MMWLESLDAVKRHQSLARQEDEKIRQCDRVKSDAFAWCMGHTAGRQRTALNTRTNINTPLGKKVPGRAVAGLDPRGIVHAAYNAAHRLLFCQWIYILEYEQTLIVHTSSCIDSTVLWYRSLYSYSERFLKFAQEYDNHECLRSNWTKKICVQRWSLDVSSQCIQLYMSVYQVVRLIP